MARTLSSAQTFAMKYLFAPTWIAIFGAGTLALFVVGDRFQDDKGLPPPPEWKWIFLTVWVGLSSLLNYSCVGLKRVRIDEQALYVSNYITEIEVPLRDVAEICENQWLNNPVTIRFNRQTKFGDSITFLPKAPFFGTRAVIGEIQEAVRRALTELR